MKLDMSNLLSEVHSDLMSECFERNYILLPTI